MSLILSGTDGLSDVDGTAATPAIRGTDANTGIFFPAADTIGFSEGGVECGRFDSSGRLLLGNTDSTSAKLNVTVDGVVITGNTTGATMGANAIVQLNNSNSITDSTVMLLGGGTGGNPGQISSGFGFTRENSASHWGTQIRFYTHPPDTTVLSTLNEAARIDSSGNLLVGTTSSTNLQNNYSFLAGGSISGAGSACFNGQNGNTVLQVNQTLDDNADRGQIYFYRNESLIGKITSSNTQTLYTDLSDYRLKNTIAPMTGALAKVALLKPCTYKWNVDGSDGQGFIAHELAEVFPTAVSGEKDAVDSEGNPNYQGVDTSLLVATLTAAIQELNAKFEEYKAAHP